MRVSTIVSFLGVGHGTIGAGLLRYGEGERGVRVALLGGFKQKLRRRLHDRPLTGANFILHVDEGRG